MSQFNEKLDQAKKRQKRLYFIAGMTVITIFLLMVSLFVVSRGTRVDIMPEEAKELAEIRLMAGFGFCVGDTVYSLSGNPEITVSAPGFRPATEAIGPAHLGKIFPIELFELPGRLIVQISGEDGSFARTVWRINGRDVALSKKLDIELDADSYTLGMDNPFYQQKELAVEIERGEQTLLQVDLIPVNGMLNISSKPSGATVFVDEKKVGLTPLQVARSGGQYSLRVAAENHIDSVERVAVTRAGPEVNRNYNLELKKAKVTLNLMPKGGTLLVNGVQGGKNSLLLDATIEHRLTYFKVGYYPQSQTVLLAADEEKEVRFELKRENGRVEISSSPSAAVWIGSREYGLSPVSINLPAVNQKITFKKPGYRTVSKTVKPKGGAVQKVSVILLKEYQAKLQEAPHQYTNQAGIELKLFMVRDDFITGAPRSEKGQRANEFQRKIRLTKPFYASLFEVTNKQFSKFNPKKGVGVANVPVISVSWQEAAAYCNWMSSKEKLRPFYTTANGLVTGFNSSADGYRLLSEGEWEWLARKAGKPKKSLFTWGDETVIPLKATNVADESAKGRVRFYVPNYSDGYSGVAPVGSFNREGSGLFDMAGNVSEWVHDVYSIVPPPPGTRASNPLGQQRGEAYVVKGANFRSGTLTTLRPSFREGLSGGRDDVGFRIGRYLYGGEDG